MESLVGYLHTSGASLVVEKDGRRTVCTGRGVSDLYRLLNDEPELLRGARVADKVVGKGAAALMALGRVGEVYADVVSRPALALLSREGIRHTYVTVVPHIINRAHTGICPVEKLCDRLDNPADCLEAIRGFLESQATKPSHSETTVTTS